MTLTPRDRKRFRSCGDASHARQRLVADLHQQRQQAIMARYGVSSEHALPIDLRWAMMYDREHQDYAVFDRELGAFYAQLSRANAVRTIYYATPVFLRQAMQQAINGLVTVLYQSLISLCHLGSERERADAAEI